MEDFRKYAVKHLGLNSQVLNDVVSAQNQYLNPYGRASVERDTDGCVFPFDDGSYHILGNPDR